LSFELNYSVSCSKIREYVTRPQLLRRWMRSVAQIEFSPSSGLPFFSTAKFGLSYGFKYISLSWTVDRWQIDTLYDSKSRASLRWAAKNWQITTENKNRWT